MVDFQPCDSEGFADIDFLINSSNNYLDFYDPIDTEDLCAFDHEEELSIELRQCAGTKRRFDDVLEDILPMASKRRNLRIVPILPQPPKHLSSSHFHVSPELTLHKIIEDIDGHLAIKSFQENIVLKIEKQEMSGSWTIEMKKHGHLCEFQFHLYEMETLNKNGLKEYILEGKVLHGEKELFYENYLELKATLASYHN